MKQFLAVFIGTKDSPERRAWEQLSEQERQAQSARGLQAWSAWSEKHAAHIVDGGKPLGKTRRVDRHGISAVTNQLVAYVVVQAEDHEAAAKLFTEHPHFTVFPGAGVEVMECLAIPS